MTPIICFGQQPCGFFPKRFLVAKFHTARRLQAEIGGEIVFFYHDSDHDPRETKTLLRHHQSGAPFDLNFAFDNKLQRKFAPLYLKRVLPDWHAKTLRRLPNLVDSRGLEAFKSAPLTNIADFCLEIYREMGLLEGIKIVRSSDPEMRRAACDVDDFFVDVPHEGEIVRARKTATGFSLHEGGDAFIELPETGFEKHQISPTRDTRLGWMQSIIGCTHYVCGAGEQAYLCTSDAPEIEYVPREEIERSNEAFTKFPA